MKICISCGSTINDYDTVCPVCGYQQKQQHVQREVQYLGEGSIIQNRYSIKRQLGFGGFGITYLAWDQKLHISVAIKEYFPRGCAVRSADHKNVTVYSFDMQDEYEYGLDRFLKEAQSLAQFHQVEGIVHIFDCIKENNTGYIIMEYLEGKTLEEVLKVNKKITVKDAKRVFFQVLDTLTIVHKKNIIHRDISPDNIFLLNNGIVKLIDFGAARHALSNRTNHMTSILKPSYSPIEQYT